MRKGQTLQLRNVVDTDVREFFEHHLESVPRVSRESRTEEEQRFVEKWTTLRADSSTLVRTIVVDGSVAGYVATFLRLGVREVSYVLGRSYWGRGIATEALSHLLQEVSERPLFARAAKDNLASLRVLEKCAFAIVREETFSSATRNASVDEFVLRRDV